MKSNTICIWHRIITILVYMQKCYISYFFFTLIHVLCAQDLCTALYSGWPNHEPLKPQMHFLLFWDSAASKHQGQVVSLWSGLSKTRTLCLALSHTMEHCLVLVKLIHDPSPRLSFCSVPV